MCAQRFSGSLALSGNLSVTHKGGGLVVFDGNSMTALSSTYPASTMTLLGGAYFGGNNFGVGAQTTLMMIADAGSQIDPLAATTPRKILCAWEIRNALFYNTNTVTECYQQMTNYCAARKAAGWKVVILTLLPASGAGYPGTFLADRNTINVLINANAIAHGWADAVADIAADSRIGDDGDELDLTYYPDGTHMTSAGYAIVAGIVAAAVRTVP